jgi:hypothetical protein
VSAFRIGIILFLGIFSSLTAFGRGPARPITRGPAPVLQARPAFSMEDPTAAAKLRLGPTVGLLNNVPGYGGLAEIAFSTGSPLYVGVESGYVQWNFSSSEGDTTRNERLMSVPILASFLYRFSIKSTIVHPYLGVSIGASVITSRLKTENSEEVTNDETTELGFTVFAKPGVEFELSKVTSFFLEPRFGSFRNKFHFMPQVGLSFAL